MITVALGLTAIAIQVLTFAFVVVASAALITRIAAQADMRRRLGEQLATPMLRPSAVVRQQGVNHPFLLWVQRSTSLADARDKAKLAHDLALAGISHPAAPVLYVVLRFALAIGLPLGFLALKLAQGEPAGAAVLVGGPLGLCALGLIAPRALLDNRINSRKLQLEHQFPDALDLMVVCVEAGLTLEAALVRVSREVAESHRRVAEEFGRVSQELAAGRGRADALRALAERADVAPVTSFVALLIQADVLGASIGQTLRTYAGEMRDHRVIGAEQKAARIPVLLTIPLVTCILPVIVTALMLPAIIDVVRNVLPAMRGG
jgi:tight adherence protein C